LKNLLASGAVLANCLGCCTVGVLGLSLAAQETLAARPNIHQLLLSFSQNGEIPEDGNIIEQVHGRLNPANRAELERWLQNLHRDVGSDYFADQNDMEGNLVQAIDAVNPMAREHILNFVDDVARNRVLLELGIDNAADRNYIIRESATGYGQDDGSLRLSGKAVDILMGKYGLNQELAREMQALLTVPDERRDWDIMEREADGRYTCRHYLCKSGAERKRLLGLE
ncbi:MAG: hypothetical protein LBL30_03895, partial [Holosporales bacterium]|jgi:hypothetical protein|nr:hypothetical protein [Holosporales bacterium]